LALNTTIKSIASDLGLSHMTVSRALSGSDKVSPETRSKVLRRAQEVGYVRNPLANAMRGGSSGLIGLLLPNIVNEFYARIANEIARLCGQHGLDVAVSLTNDDPQLEARSLVRLAALKAAAVIVVPAPGKGVDGTPVDWQMRRIELVRTSGGSGAEAALLIDDTKSMSEAARLLKARGCRKIGYVGALTSLSSGRARLAAFRAAMSEAGIAFSPSACRTVEPIRAAGQDAFNDLWAGPDRPDALVCGGIEVGKGVLDACLSLRLNMPDDLALIGYGDPDGFRWLAGGVTTIAFEPEELARRGLDLLLSEGGHGVSCPVRSALRVRSTA
jgi:DNA-binding LacI/PurR family transcriptional regulator